MPQPAYTTATRKKVRVATLLSFVAMLLVLVTLSILDKGRTERRSDAIRKVEIKGIVSKVETEVKYIGRNRNLGPLSFTVIVKSNKSVGDRQYELTYPGEMAGEITIGDSICKAANSQGCSQYKRVADSFMFYGRFELVL